MSCTERGYFENPLNNATYNRCVNIGQPSTIETCPQGTYFYVEYCVFPPTQATSPKPDTAPEDHPESGAESPQEGPHNPALVDESLHESQPLIQLQAPPPIPVPVRDPNLSYNNLGK